MKKFEIDVIVSLSSGKTDFGIFSTEANNAQEAVDKYMKHQPSRFIDSKVEGFLVREIEDE